MFTINNRSVLRALSRAEILKRFGDALRGHRQRAGLSQEKLAAKAGIDRTYVGGAERGERNVALVNIVRLAEALDISAAELLDPIGKEG
ncbi:MAG TPA: helix-turn-helix transcriptional regulator [Longimicrobium sp.]|uniref:helix-turn-helix domain-containing protein n=1 Tax=Longimicrobium sp. TaxID=2029185 RepID=UPI002ED7B2EE